MQGIFGIYPWAILLVAIILVLGFIIYSSRKGQSKLRKLTEGKIVVDFYTPSDCLTFLAAEEKGEVHPPKGYKGDPSKLGTVKLPKNPDDTESIELDTYYTLPEGMKDTWWPQGRPKKQQIKMKKTAFIVGIPLPIVCIAQEKWTTEMMQTVAASLIGLSRDEMALRVLNAQDSSFWSNVDKIREMLQGIPMMRIACFVAAGAAGIAMILIWQLSGKVDQLVKLFVGG